MKKLLSLAALAALLFVSSVSGFAQDAKPGKEPVLDTVTELHKKGFNVLVAAISKTDYAAKIQAGAYTLLAPTDVAFRDLPKAELDALLADKEKLTTLLSYHIIEGKLSSADLKAGGVKTLGGTTVEAKLVDGKLKIGPATVVRLDIPSATGTIHGVDKLLQP
jgi:uncharacterized surface protein with fasciclin (FAS1) repeats